MTFSPLPTCARAAAVEHAVEEVFKADKNEDDKLSGDEFRELFGKFKASLARSQLGGKFFRDHLTDLALDAWDDANPEVGKPPIQAPTRDYTQGDCWHCLAGTQAVQQELEARQSLLHAQAEKEKARNRKANKMNCKRDDFIFNNVFAKKRAELGLNY